MRPRHRTQSAEHCRAHEAADSSWSGAQMETLSNANGGFLSSGAARAAYRVSVCCFCASTWDILQKCIFGISCRYKRSSCRVPTILFYTSRSIKHLARLADWGMRIEHRESRILLYSRFAMLESLSGIRADRCSCMRKWAIHTCAIRGCGTLFVCNIRGNEPANQCCETRRSSSSVSRLHTGHREFIITSLGWRRRLLSRHLTISAGATGVLRAGELTHTHTLWCPMYTSFD